MSTPNRPAPVGDRPVVEARDPEDLRADLAEKRARLGDTVEELVHRADVPARVRERRDETVARVQEQVAQTSEQVRRQAVRAQETLAEKAPAVERTVRERPAALLGVGAAVVVFLLIRRRRRHRGRAEG